MIIYLRKRSFVSKGQRSKERNDDNMKKLICAVLVFAMMLSLSSCVVFYSLAEAAMSSGGGSNSEEKYNPCEKDFEDAASPMGTTCAYQFFAPTKDSFYYFTTDSYLNYVLCRADSEGTVSISPKDNSVALVNEYSDPWLAFQDDKVYFTAYDDTVSASGKLYCCEIGSDEAHLVAETNSDYAYWNVSGDFFVYVPYEEEADYSTEPHNLYTLISLDFVSSKSSEISKDNVVDFRIVDGKLVFITYESKEGFEVFRCDPSGKNMEELGKIEMEYNPKYASINGFHITEKYVAFWGDTGVGDSQTDVVSFSLETGKTKSFEFSQYSSTFAACGSYGFITFVREDESPDENPEPMKNEGIFRIDLATGETELVSQELAFNISLVAFSEDCIYAEKCYYLESARAYTHEYSRVKLGEGATLVYSYFE